MTMKEQNKRLKPTHFQRLSLDQHFDPDRKKRVLSLDGGGLRGAITIAILEKIEAMLTERHGGDQAFRLADYFDLIGGTSTGSIIATALAAKSMTAADVGELFRELGPRIFRNGFLRLGLTRAKFDGAKLDSAMRGILGDMTLGSDKIATALAIVAKRADTASTWVIHNNPRGKYFPDPPDKHIIGNHAYLLRNIIRASTAAPYYFKPERVKVAEDEPAAVFVDGGVTPHNNPAFQMLMLAGLNGYNFEWKLHPDHLMMISIGTGSLARTTPSDEYARKLQLSRTVAALTSMISGAEDFVELLMQWVSDSRNPRIIDREIGDQHGEFLCGKPLLSYQRYQCQLTTEALKHDFDFSINDKQLKRLRDMTDPRSLPIAFELGEAMAEKLIHPDHLPTHFDLEPMGEESPY